MSADPKTIVLIHGLWLTPRCWEHFRGLYESRGHRVLAPAWPRMTGEVEDVRRDPAALDGLGVAEVVSHYERIVRDLDAPPIIMGHSLGGLIVQLLLDRGLGAAGVAIAAVPPKGVLGRSVAALRAAGPVLRNPANCSRTVALTFEQFDSAFANAMDLQDARAAYDRYAVPGPGRPVFQAALASLVPWSTDTRVDFGRGRPPLLFIAGQDDHQVPASLVRAARRKYGWSGGRTDLQEFAGRSHLIIAQAGWREVARFALDWSLAHTEDDYVAPSVDQLVGVA